MKAMSVISNGISSVRARVAKLLERQHTLVGRFVWNERRYAKQTSLEVLELYWTVRREHPELTGRSLYEAVVARRFSPESTDARTIVRRAEESFADWPRKQDLQFRDVVHYLVFDEYLRLFNTRHGTRANLGYIVSRIIPAGL